MIKVVNIRHYGKPREPWEVYIGRWTGSRDMKASPLRNPFSEKEYGREGCITKFKKVFETATVCWHPAIRDEIHRLLALHKEHGKLTLICWCAPPQGVTARDKPFICHGQIIAAYLEEYIEKDAIHKTDKPD